MNKVFIGATLALPKTTSVFWVSKMRAWRKRTAQNTSCELFQSIWSFHCSNELLNKHLGMNISPRTNRLEGQSMDCFLSASGKRSSHYCPVMRQLSLRSKRAFPCMGPPNQQGRKPMRKTENSSLVAFGCLEFTVYSTTNKKRVTSRLPL